MPMMDRPTDATSPESAKKSPFDDMSKEELVQKCKGLLTIAQKAKQARCELLTENENYKANSEKYEKEKKAYLDNIQTLQELVNSLTEQKLNCITEVDSANTKLKLLTNKCSSYEDEINKYKADIIIKEKNYNDTTQKLSDLDSEIISLKRQNKRLLDENEQLISQLSELETQANEFNKIGLQQREQLTMLEEKVQSDNEYQNEIEKLNSKIEELQKQLQSNKSLESHDQQLDYEKKIQEITDMFETEKSKKEKANIKLRSYKDKILKCAACINQLKNSRFILAKTVKEYSESIPKWQNDILRASKVLDGQINQLNNENLDLKEKNSKLENMLAAQNDATDIDIHQLKEIKRQNEFLNSVITVFKQQYNESLECNRILKEDLENIKTEREKENTILSNQIIEIRDNLNKVLQKNKELSSIIENLKSENKELLDSKENRNKDNDVLDTMALQIRALENEKSMLVKEKMNARDSVIELENQNKSLTSQLQQTRSDLQVIKSEQELLLQQKSALETNYKTEQNEEINNLKLKMKMLQEQYDLLTKQHDDLQDLNSLLKEEVETLKLSLEQPKDETDGSDLNDSLQADIVKLETKLSAYKQENASLLAEVKETRAKIKEFDNLLAESEDNKSKLMGYKTENAELLNEMKEINQVLKERGEAISKLQKAIAELERLVETLEKDRDVSNQEKEDLKKKIENLENDLKNAESKTDTSSEINDQIVVERDNALKLVSEKEAIINSLKEEIDKFKQPQVSSDFPHEDMSTSTISKAEEQSRMKDLDETFEEKYTKLRIFALKLKKKLNETTTQLQNLEQDKAKLEKLVQENSSKQSQSYDVTDGGKKEEIGDLQAQVMTLTATAEAAEKKAVELEKVQAELESKSKELAAEIEAHKVTKDQLEKARRDAKKKNVLSLEMEDYERSMKELTTKMEDKKKKMIQMESTIDTQEGTITAMKTQIKLLEEQIKSEETTKRLIREELQHAIEEGREKDNVLQTKNDIITKLEHDLEDEKRKNEESDLEMTAMISEKEKIIMALGEDKAELNNKVKRLEFKCSELNEKLRIVNIELGDLKTEYTSYKVRAQAVLRQNQTVDHSHEEQLKEEAAALKAQIETLTVKLTTLSEECASRTSEAESARRRASEASSEAARAQQRTARLQADLARLAQQIDDDRTQHKLQISTLTQCYKAQISELEARLQAETDALKKELASQESDRAKRDDNSNQYLVPVIPKEESDGEMDINVSMIPREEGEGSEAAPSPPPSKSYMTSAGSGRSPVPLERLLEEGVPEDEALDSASLALSPDQEIADLRRRLLAQQQRVKHVTVLLSESEREGARLSQLSELLKAELRRVRAATQNAHNTEYMKNVTLKFLTLGPGDERSRLVPVLQKILTLTPDETQKIQAIARGQDPNARGWGSYLPWPGGK